MSFLSGVRPTKGFLFQMKKRLGFIERGCEFLKLKRDHLAKELRESLEVLRGQRQLLIEQLKEAYEALTAAYLTLGPMEVKSQTRSVRRRLKVDVLPLSTMGVLYPMVKILEKPSIDVELDASLAKAAEKIMSLLEQLIHLAEFEARTERIADELGKTNRKVNALENIVIPQFKNIIKFIEDKIEEESLDELVRLKLIGGALARRRE